MSHDHKHGFGDKLLHKLHIGGKEKTPNPPSASSHATHAQPQAHAAVHTQAQSTEPTGAIKAPESLPREPVNPVENLKSANNASGASQAFSSPAVQGTTGYTGSSSAPQGPTTPGLTSQGPAGGLNSHSDPATTQSRAVEAPLGSQSSPSTATGTRLSEPAHGLPSGITSATGGQSGISAFPTGTKDNTSKYSTGPSTGYQQPKQYDTMQGLEPTGQSTNIGASTHSQQTQSTNSVPTNAAGKPPQTTLQQTQQRAAELTSSAAAGAQQIGGLGREKAAQAYNAVANELDRQGINSETSKQKLADIGQGVKDYSAVGGERAAEYLQQAVDTAHAIGTDEENRGVLIRILGAVVLIWLAFGFSTRAFLTLGLVALGGFLVSRLSKKGVAHRTAARPSNAAPGTIGQGRSQGYEAQGRPANTLAASGQSVETHFPMGSRGAAHPDASIENPAKAAAATF